MGTTGSFPTEHHLTPNPNAKHRVVEDVGSNLWSNLPAQKGSPRSSCPGLFPDSFLISPKIETLSLAGQLHSEEVFSDVQREPFSFQFCPLTCVLLLVTTEKSLTPSSF